MTDTNENLDALKSPDMLGDPLLLRFCQGDLTPAEDIMVATYLSLNPEARKRTRRYMALGAACAMDIDLDVLPPKMVEISDKDIEACLTLASKMSPDTASKSVPSAPKHDTNHPAIKEFADTKLPEPLAQILSAETLSELRWRNKGRPFAEVKIKTGEAKQTATLALMAFDKGTHIPHHSHTNDEATLILCGSLVDGETRATAGDILWFEAEDHTYPDQANDAKPVPHGHAPYADDLCICLIMTKDDLKFTNPLMNFIGHLWRKF